MSANAPTALLPSVVTLTVNGRLTLGNLASSATAVNSSTTEQTEAAQDGDFAQLGVPTSSAFYERFKDLGSFTGKLAACTIFAQSNGRRSSSLSKFYR